MTPRSIVTDKLIPYIIFNTLHWVLFLDLNIAVSLCMCQVMSGIQIYVLHRKNWPKLSWISIPGHADAIIGRLDLLLSSSSNWFCLYLVMNSTQDSTRVKSLLQLVSKIALTPKDLKNLVSFLKAWNIRSYALNPDRSRIWNFASQINFKEEPYKKRWEFVSKSKVSPEQEICQNGLQ